MQERLSRVRAERSKLVAEINARFGSRWPIFYLQAVRCLASAIDNASYQKCLYTMYEFHLDRLVFEVHMEQADVYLCRIRTSLEAEKKLEAEKRLRRTKGVSNVG